MAVFWAPRLADWFPSFAIRYYHSPLAEAGLVIGAITVVAGVAGNALGAGVAAELEPRWRSAFLKVPALFTIPGSVFLFVAINADAENRWVAYLWLLLSEVFLWTMLAPIAALLINVTAPELRARAMALSILTQHLLGDVISPPIIGAISDAHGLKAGVQITWVAVLVSGGCWGVGAMCLSPLPVAKRDEARENDGTSSTGSNIYYSILFGSDEKPSSLLVSDGSDTGDECERENTSNPILANGDEETVGFEVIILDTIRNSEGTPSRDELSEHGGLPGTETFPEGPAVVEALV
jgi:hypothetical protein